MVGDTDFFGEREIVFVPDERGVVETLAVCENVFNELFEELDEPLTLRDICAVLDPVRLINDVTE